MPEENLQLDQEDISDDELAASLGFLTSLSERSMTPMEEETDMQEDTEEGDDSLDDEPDKPENRDAEQDTDIVELERRLTELENSVGSETNYGQTPTDTGTEI